jgi:Rrf2 family nitric oxide-sensitive transcriptional repressor
MTLNLFTDYSLRVLMYAALPGKERFSLDDVSQAYGISRDHVAKVVQRLVHREYLYSKRGRGGGISLAKAAAEIRVGHIVREMEAHPAILECFHLPTNTCRLAGNCQLKGAIGEALSAFYAVLDGYTIADLISRPLPLLNLLGS